MAEGRKSWARRMLRRDFETFFLGTAIFKYLNLRRPTLREVTYTDKRPPGKKLKISTTYFLAFLLTRLVLKNARVFQ